MEKKKLRVCCILGLLILGDLWQNHLIYTVALQSPDNSNGIKLSETPNKLEKHSESADLRQAAHLWVHMWQESFKKVLEPDGNPEHHQN